MKSQSLSQREKLLLPMAVAVIVLVLYGAFRLRPGLKQIESLRADLSKAVQGRETLTWPTQSPSDVSRLRAEIQKLETQRKNLLTTLAENEDSLASLSNSTELQSLRIQISALARQHNLTVIKNVPADGGREEDSRSPLRLRLRLDDAPSQPQQEHAPFIQEYFQLAYARPLQRLELRATYSALQQFIAALAELDHRVHVASFRIKMNDDPDAVAEPRLHSELVLAL